MNVCTVYKLTVSSSIMGCVSIGLLALAVSTDSWLLTREFYATQAVDASMGNVTDSKTWLRVWTGLWRFCMVDENLPDDVYCMAVNYDVSSTGRGESDAITTTTIIEETHLEGFKMGCLWRIRCIKIWQGKLLNTEMLMITGAFSITSYYTNTGCDGYRAARRTDASYTIYGKLAAARGAVALPVSALIFSIAAVIFTAVGNIRKDVKTLIGGVLFVLAGLSLAVGMILYISAINDEVGYRSSTSKHEDGFSYAYGWSFYTAGFGFLASELSAVVTITLFLRRNENLEDMARIIPGLEDKVAQGSSANSADHQVIMGCHCDREDEVFIDDGCCSLCCPEELHRKEAQLPWYGSCAKGACGGQHTVDSDEGSSSRPGRRTRSRSVSA
ncbi:voltage-dependent calcium channel gamma subunit [Plakobranchus ocellatus]|uniref:Voltage-dependent calcium channel gamma subunit n=1 Tax=Plakobranchus ocellatus TaxID=259542 RepID=A0AAV4D2K6_9GAST|nr:voltage-dependent calcium channel gamma subunit [Plakobranchus ocellatus]